MGRALAALVGLCLLACDQAEGPYPGHDRVLEAVQEYDLADLSRLMRGARASDDADQLFVVALASYLVDPLRYEDRFIEYFPARRVMEFVYEKLERRGLTPSPLWSFGELGRVAIDGHPAALAKLAAVASHAEPPVLPVVCDALVRAFDVHTAAALRGLDQLSRSERPRAYRCFDALTPDAARATLRQLEPERGAAPSVGLELLARLAERAGSAF